MSSSRVSYTLADWAKVEAVRRVAAEQGIKGTLSIEDALRVFERAVEIDNEATDTTAPAAIIRRALREVEPSGG